MSTNTRRRKGKSAIKKGKSKVFEVVDDEDDEESEDEERDLMFQSLLTLTEAYRKKYYSKPNSNNRRFSSRGRGFTRSAQNQVQNFAPRSQGTYVDEYATKGVEEGKEVAEIVEEKKTNENITCFKCGKKGHVARICPAKLSKVEILRKKLELAEKQEQGLVVMADDEEWLDVSDTEDQAQMCFMGLMEEESDEEEEESSDSQTALEEKPAFYNLTDLRMSARFPILKGFEMKEEFSEMQEIKKHDPLYHGDKYHRSESECENEGTLKPYVPTLELEKKIYELENKIQELLEQNEVLISKNKNFVTWNSSETDSKSFVSDILIELLSSVSNSIFDIPDSNCDSETQDSASKIYTGGLDDIQEDIIRVVTSDGYVEYKEPSAIASTDIVTPYQLKSIDNSQLVERLSVYEEGLHYAGKNQKVVSPSVTEDYIKSVRFTQGVKSMLQHFQKQLDLKKQKSNIGTPEKSKEIFTQVQSSSVKLKPFDICANVSTENVSLSLKSRQKKKTKSRSRKHVPSMQYSSSFVTPTNRRSSFSFNKNHVPFNNSSINKKATMISSNSQHADETHTMLINSSDLSCYLSNFLPFQKFIVHQGIKYFWDPISRASHKWYLDYGCSKHMTGRKEILSNYKEEYGGSVKFGNNELALVVGQDVAHVVGLNRNLFSISKFCDKDLEVNFKKRRCVVRTEEGRESSLRQAVLLHKRLSHLNFRYIDKIVKH
ncbi:hypothetical protein OSB04_024803 [Centaurea solstitialis]|uniref:CCHC-type domain-containing protein n=1 Tax=Centaurea solstitialis TaxID=347529 RepID=A0AA38SYI3_9ASTR|nr:hypothetical protein OSB04_024803 [Centaurea solstitialis]